jgi:hypothetical protein
MSKDDRKVNRQALLVSENTVGSTFAIKRINKTVVELTIGVIGVIGVMFAQLGANHESALAASPKIGEVKVEQQFLVTTANLKRVTPLVRQVNWFNLLF